MQKTIKLDDLVFYEKNAKAHTEDKAWRKKASAKNAGKS